MKKLIFVTILCTFVWLGLAGCHDDCPTCPGPECTDCPYDGRLYVAMDSPHPGVYIFDTKTDSLIDSVVFRSTGLAVSVPSSGSEFSASDDRATSRIFDAASFEKRTELVGEGTGRFAGRSSVFFTKGLGSLRVYSYPSLQLNYLAGLPVPLFFRIRGEETSLYGVQGSDTLLEFDLDSAKIVHQWRIRIAEAQFLKKFDVSTDGTKLYGQANTTDGDLFYAYDLVGDSVLSKFRLVSYFGDVRIHPNGREVWVCDPGSPFNYPWPDQIYVFDSQTGRHLYSISLQQELNPNGAIPDVYGIEFTPDGSAAYLRNGHEFSYSGTIPKVDCRSKKVTKVLFPNWDRYPTSMAIGPKPGAVHGARPRVPRLELD